MKVKKAEAEALLMRVRMHYETIPISSGEATAIMNALRRMEYPVAAAVIERHLRGSLFVPTEDDLAVLQKQIEAELRDTDEGRAEEASMASLMKTVKDECWSQAELINPESPDFAGAVRGHREQCIANARDVGALEPHWALRVEACDRILSQGPGERKTVEMAP